MSSKKRQHYVPQFYLRNFAEVGRKHIIGLFNIPSDRYVPDAKLKTQAYKKYFYGRDGAVEDAIGMLEDRAAIYISEIIERDEPPTPRSEGHHVLLAFLILLRQRTYAAGERHNEMTDKLMKAVLTESQRLDREAVKDTRFGYDYPVLLGLGGDLNDMILFALDLKYKIIVNRTPQGFITSDNPVVLYNQFLETRLTVPGGTTGLQTKGLQMFLPLSPLYQICFYDGDVYKFGPRRQTLIQVTQDCDIAALNSLQCMNAHRSLYFLPSCDERSLRSLLSVSNRHRLSSHLNLIKGRLIENGIDAGTVLHMFPHELRCRLELSFAHLLKKAKDYDVHARTFHPRNAELSEVYEEFKELVQAGHYKRGEFSRYLSDMAENQRRMKRTAEKTD